MRTSSFLPAAGLALALAFSAGSALAEKPDGAGGGGGKHADKHEKHGKHADKHEKHGKHADQGERNAAGHPEHGDRKADQHARKHDGDRRAPRPGAYFDDRHRESVRHYYASHDGRHCPPGLAKKNNGCMPPGQAKKWHVGKRLPADVVVYRVPQPILVTLPPPPPQHKYVRVAGDILLIAVGTSMVVDGINGLLR